MGRGLRRQDARCHGCLGPVASLAAALPGKRLDHLAARRGWPAIRPAVDAAFASLAALHDPHRARWRDALRSF